MGGDNRLHNNNIYVFINKVDGRDRWGKKKNIQLFYWIILGILFRHSYRFDVSHYIV